MFCITCTDRNTNSNSLFVSHKFVENIIYKGFNEDLIYWKTLDALKLKIDKIVTFQ